MIYYDIKASLIARGFGIDNDAKENSSGELREFIHPKTGKRLAYIDAILAQMEIEEEAKAK